MLSYFRAILKAQEVSPRAFEMTQEVIEVNPGFYTAWHYRLSLLRPLNISLAEELGFASKKAVETPKNYQIWYYRRELLELLQDPSIELEFLDIVLKIDEKNIHAWGHRHWVVSRFQLWDSELETTAAFIERDPRNNSAWNHRYYVISQVKDLADVGVRWEEAEFALKYIKENPNNESPWNYLRGLYSLVRAEDYKGHVLEILETKGHTALLLQFLAFSYKTEGKGDLERALCHLLTSVDSIRRHYWAWRARAASGSNVARSAMDLLILPKLCKNLPVPSVMFTYYFQSAPKLADY